MNFIMKHTPELPLHFLSKFAIRWMLVLPCFVMISGCGQQVEQTMGVSPATEKIVAVKELSSSPKSQKVTVRGAMIEKCPVAGCWFVLRDKTGTVRVDTKAAGFVVTEIPLNTPLTVSGTVTEGSQPGLAASGLSY